MARCRTRQQNISGTQGHVGQSRPLCDTSILQLLHHVCSTALPLPTDAKIASRLLFMTYNGWVMIAVAVGAFIGYLAFGAGMTSTKSVACH
jgi:hypothetical protein